MFALVTGVQTCALPISTHDFDWIRRNIPQGMNAQLFDVTSANAVLSLMGPKARDILQAVTRDDVSNEAFRFGTARRIGTAGCPVLALRVPHVGKPGWEVPLHTDERKRTAKGKRGEYQVALRRGRLIQTNIKKTNQQ